MGASLPGGNSSTSSRANSRSTPSASPSARNILLSQYQRPDEEARKHLNWGKVLVRLSSEDQHYALHLATRKGMESLFKNYPK
jgi:hypothetical protein